MASTTNSVWAIDIGNNSLKALRLTDVNGVVEVIDFDNIKHGKILSGKGVQDLEKNELIAISLRQFIQKHEIANDDVIISLPSQNSFARFVTLPPVEPKRIPEIIRFEAVQQIPFDINDVQWDWQLMADESSEENKVGIFAIKSEVIASMLEHFSREDIQIRYIQMAPMALYNYAVYDRSDLSEGDGIVILNIGAEYSDLVVCTKSTVWQRCIPMGGNSFTKAISEAFRINFEKAENLKRKATMTKYARQILQAMKPVFADLSSEVQRSIGFYTSSNPDTKIVKIVAMGGGTRMRGLLKYLQQSLQMPVERTDSFEKLAIASDISPAKFHENVCNFGIVYGLGLQALGLGKIESNLLPRNIARSMAWASKSKYFIAAASLLLLVSVLAFGRVLLDKAGYRARAASETRERTSQIVQRASQASNKLQEQKQRKLGTQAMIEKQLSLFNHREVVPKLMQAIISALPNEQNTSDEIQKKLYRAFAASDVENIKKIKRNERKQIFITDMSIRFSEDISTAEFDDKGTRTAKRTIRRASLVDRRAKKLEQQQQMMDEMMRRMIDAQKIREMMEKEEEEQEYEDEEPEAQESESRAGFLVTIIGYSPYKDIDNLMEPLEVGDDREKWGFITRLRNHDVAVDDDRAFELFERTNPKNFKLEIHPIDLGKYPPPMGIGVESERRIEIKSETASRLPTYFGQLKQAQRLTIEPILIDPATKEVISVVGKYNEDGTQVTDDKTGETVYETNDYWFRLQAKFLWKDVPKEIVSLLGEKR